MTPRSRRRSAGFTLVELMIVVAVIAILSGLFVQNAQSAVEETRAIACERNRVLLEDMEKHLDHDLGRPSVSIHELVDEGYVNKAVCPRGGVLTWTVEDPTLNYAHQALVCSLHGEKTRIRKWLKGMAVSDDPTFDLASNFDGTTADGWSQARGKYWQVVDGKYRAGSLALNRSGHHQSFSGDAAWTDYELTGKAKLNKGNGYGFYFRTDVSNPKKIDGYVLTYEPNNSRGSLVIRKVTNGRNSRPIAKVKVGRKGWVGTEKEFRVDVSGDTFTAYVDGEKMLTATDSTYSSGGVGLRSMNKSVTDFDDVKVKTK